MKTFTILFTMTLAITVLTQESNSQEISLDSVKSGRFYNFLLSNDDWIEGEVLIADSLFIKLRQTDGTVSRFSKQQVKTLIVPSNYDVREYYTVKYACDYKESEKVMEPRLSLGGGLGLTTFESTGGFPSSYVIDFEGTLFLSRNVGIRLYVDCNFFKNNNNYSYSSPEYYSYEEGGNVSIYLFSMDLLIGSLKPEQKTKQYFTCGLGAFVFSESDRKSYSTYGTERYPGESFGYAGLKIGYGVSHSFTTKITAGGELLYGTPFEYLYFGILLINPRITYKISKRLDLFLEPQYAFPVGFGDFGGFFIDYGYLTVKTGITLCSF
jgi:hypothetical protein